MTIGIICCRTLEEEMRAVIRNQPGVHRLEVLNWELHIDPDRLLATVIEKIRLMEDEVQAVLLGYGRCQAMDRLPNDFKVPVLRPAADDCIGILLGQKRYEEELQREAGTWFFTPGWTEMGMDFVFHELQISQMADKFIAGGKDPMELAHRMLRDYTRGLFIDMALSDQTELMKKAREICKEFGFRLERTPGSLSLLQEAMEKALAAAGEV